MTRSLKLLDELMGKLMAKEFHAELVALRSTMEAESAREQNINAKLQARVRDLGWKLQGTQEGTRP